MLSDVCEAEFVMGLGSGRWLATLMFYVAFVFHLCVNALILETWGYMEVKCLDCKLPLKW